MELENTVWIIGGVLLSLWVILFIIVLFICAKVNRLSKRSTEQAPAKDNNQFQARSGAAESVYSFGKSNITPGEELSTRYQSQPRSEDYAEAPRSSIPPDRNLDERQKTLNNAEAAIMMERLFNGGGGGPTSSKSLPQTGYNRYDYPSQQQRPMPQSNYNYPKEPLSPRNNNNFIY